MTADSIAVLPGQEDALEVLAGPRRIQRRRTKGWRMPEGAVYVGRGSKWGNPYKVGEAQVRMPAIGGGEWEHEGRLHKRSRERHFFCTGTDDRGMPVGTMHQVEDATPEQCVLMYREYLTGADGAVHIGYRSRQGAALHEEILQLAGKNLACWCPEDRPCHADVLLKLANGSAS